MSEIDETRRREDASIRMETAFSIFQQAYAKDQERTEQWRKDFDNRLKPLEDMRASYKMARFAIIGILAAAIVDVVHALFKFAGDHIKL
jgi:hypothetical protein